MSSPPIGPDDLRAALPDTSSVLSLRGLEGPVEIIRDRRGIPHIRASTVRDGFFAQGFATAQDRLWHMDYDRRRAYGRWAELTGPTALDQDKSMRRFRLEASARADYQTIGGAAREMVDHYASGVNAFIDSADNLPVEYRIVGDGPEPWQPWDSMAVFKVRHILMGSFERKLWSARLVNHLGPEVAATLMPAFREGHLLIVPPGAEYSGPSLNDLKELLKDAGSISLPNGADGGSNNWALAGSRTSSGKPLLAGDPHRGLDTPSVYYQNHLSCPEFDVVGLSFPGVPGFPHFGHNAWVAWCVTHAMADYQDLYIERFKKDDPGLYLFRGEWRKAEVHREVLRVKDGQQVEMDVTVTHHGPVILGEPSEGQGIAFRCTATAEPIPAFNSLRSMLQACSVEEMEAAMRDWVDPVNSFVTADVSGNISYLTRGKLPVRPRANAWLPVPGWTGEQEWQGIVPFEEMPRARNPETGYIVTANNRIVDEDYPHYIGLEYSPDYRARRVRESIEKLDGAVVSDMAAIHADCTSIPAQAMSRLLSRVKSADPDVQAARDRLLDWNGCMDKNAVEPTIYSAFQIALTKIVVSSLLGSLGEEAINGTGRGGPGWLAHISGQLHLLIQEGDASLLPDGGTWETVMAQALGEAVDWLRARLGGEMDSWLWSRVHTTRPQHTLSPSFPGLAELLDPPSVSMNGDGHTPLASGYSSGNPFVVTSASMARYVFDLGDWDSSAWVVPLGASGHPGSPHYADQTPAWADTRLLPMLYDWTRIAKEAESVQRLSPAG
ncbi:MAG: penicillin acylase family protein [Dehalococcoidia bacterium]